MRKGLYLINKSGAPDWNTKFFELREQYDFVILYAGENINEVPNYDTYQRMCIANKVNFGVAWEFNYGSDDEINAMVTACAKKAMTYPCYAIIEGLSDKLSVIEMRVFLESLLKAMQDYNLMAGVMCKLPTLNTYREFLADFKVCNTDGIEGDKDCGATLSNGIITAISNYPEQCYANGYYGYVKGCEPVVPIDMQGWVKPVGTVTEDTKEEKPVENKPIETPVNNIINTGLSKADIIKICKAVISALEE